MAVKLTVTTNANQIVRKMQLRGRGMKRAITMANWDLARYAQARARSYAPIESGYLRQSILVTRVTDRGFTVEAVAPYAKFQESGTKPSSNFGFVRRGGYGKYGQGFMEARSFRKHPGVRAKKFMAKAREDMRRTVKRVYSSRIRSTIRSV